MAFKSSWTNSTPNDSLTVTISPSPAANDFLIAWAITDSLGTVITPTGWTLTATLRSTFDNADLVVYRKLSNGTETSVVFSIDGAHAMIGGVVSFDGVDTTTPLDVAVGTLETSVSGTTGDTSITPVTNNAQLVYVYCIDDGTGDSTFTFTTQTGTTGAWTTRTDQTSGFFNVAVGTAEQTTAGALTARCTTSQSGGRLGVLFALRPTGGAATTPKGPLGNPFFGPFGGPI